VTQSAVSNDLSQAFVKRVRAIRQGRGISVRELVERLHGIGFSIPEQKIRKQEFALTAPIPLDQAVAVAKVLGISLDKLTDPFGCSTCQDMPLVGYTCNECGSSAPMGGERE
jgi:transcriptional regulator with XRE-family HTH domain